jgi:hypothetical protein
MARETRRAIITGTLGVASLLVGPPSAGTSFSMESLSATSSGSDDAGMAAASKDRNRPAGLSTLAIRGRVVRPASAAHPRRLHLALENRGEQPVTLRPDRRSALFHNLPRLTGPGGPFVPVPVGSDLVAAPDLATDRIDGCWRFRTTDGDSLTRTTIAARETRTVDPGATYAIEHDLYVADTAGPCRPTGTYTATVEQRLEGPAATESFAVSLVLTVPDAGAATLSVDGPAAG